MTNPIQRLNDRIGDRFIILAADIIERVRDWDTAKTNPHPADVDPLTIVTVRVTAPKGISIATSDVGRDRIIGTVEHGEVIRVQRALADILTREGSVERVE